MRPAMFVVRQMVVQMGLEFGPAGKELSAGGSDRRMVRAVCQGTDQTLQRAGRPGRTPWAGPEKSAFPHPTRSADQTEPPAALDPSADPIGRAEAQRVEKTIAKAEGLEICPSPQDRALNGRQLLADAQANEPLTPLVPLSPGEARGKSQPAPRPRSCQTEVRSLGPPPSVEAR
ncbi:MAG: hypothetical protein CNCCGFBP_01899 [Fimbriimonadaceae bacterium]|nr:hypothetical protein [Fimbriimonadaceae bacterium]